MTFLTIEGLSQGTSDSIYLDKKMYKDLIETIKKRVESYNKRDKDFKMKDLTYLPAIDNKQLFQVKVILKEEEIYYFFVDSKTYEITEVIDMR